MFLKKPNGRFRADTFIHCWVRPVEDWIQDRTGHHAWRKEKWLTGWELRRQLRKFSCASMLTWVWISNTHVKSQYSEAISALGRWGQVDPWSPLDTQPTLVWELQVLWETLLPKSKVESNWERYPQSTSGRHIHIRTNTCTSIPPSQTDTRHCSTGIQKEKDTDKNKQISNDKILSPYNLYIEITTYIKLAFQRRKNKKENN